MKKQLTKMDFWVLAVVLALIASVFVKGWAMRRLPEVSSFSYQMELTDLEGDIVPGDTVLCLAGKQPIGTVTKVQTEGDRLILTLQAEGFPIEGGWRTNVYDILPGFEDDFYTEIIGEDDSSTKTASWYGIVTDIF